MPDSGDTEVESSFPWDEFYRVVNELAELSEEEVRKRLARLAAEGATSLLVRRLELHVGIEALPRYSDELSRDTLVGGEYRIVGTIGKGGMGIVYEAVLEKTGQTVALKMVLPGVILDDMRQRFLGEMRALGRLDHPGIVSLRHAGTHTFPDMSTTEFFVMERIAGVRLHDHLRSAEATPVERLRIIRDAALAVEYAHDRGVIHRDLKPGNMMLRSDGRLVIFDFGLASALHEGPSPLPGAEGTIPYMAPEQAEGTAASPAADIYSLGAIFYEILTGEFIYQPGPNASRSEKLAMARRPPPRDPPPFLEPGSPLLAILDKALAILPEDRFSSAAAFARALNRLLPAHLVQDLPHKWHPAAGLNIPATDWVLEERLGDGAHGQVWLARNRPVITTDGEPDIPSPRVYKFCASEEAARSLRREVRVFRLLRTALPTAKTTPAIVPIITWSLDDVPCYTAMEWIPGAQDLENWIAQLQAACLAPEHSLPEEAAFPTSALDVVASADYSEPQSPEHSAIKLPDVAASGLSEETSIAILCHVADALQFAHQNGVLHRDIKPDNILIRQDPTAPGGVSAWLMDFGLADIDDTLWQGILSRSFTSPGQQTKIVGAPDYIAPEVKRGNPATTRSDLYALGVVFYRLLCRDTRAPLLNWRDRIHDPFLREDLTRLLAENPEDRFPSAASFSAALRALPARRIVAIEAAAAALTAETARHAELAAAKKLAYQKGVMRAATYAAAVVMAVSYFAWFSFKQYKDVKRSASHLRLAEVQAVLTSSQPNRRAQMLNRIREAEGDYALENIFEFRNAEIAALNIPILSAEAGLPLGSVSPDAYVSRGGGWICWRDGKTVHTAKADETRLTNMATMQLPQPVVSCVVSEDGSLVGVLTVGGQLHLLDGQGRLQLLPGEFADQGLAVHVSPSGTFAAAAGRGGQVYLFQRKDEEWEVHAMLGRRPPELEAAANDSAENGPIIATAETVAFSPDGQKVVIGGSSSLLLTIWDTASGELFCTCENRSILRAATWDLAQRGMLWALLADGSLVCWDAANPTFEKLPATPPKFRQVAQRIIEAPSLDVSGEEPFLLCTTGEGSRAIYSTADMECLDTDQPGGGLRCGFGSGFRRWSIDAAGVFRSISLDGLRRGRRIGGNQIARLVTSTDGKLLAGSCTNLFALGASGASIASVPARSLAIGVAFSPGNDELYASTVTDLQVWKCERMQDTHTSIGNPGRNPNYGFGADVAAFKVAGRTWIALANGVEFVAFDRQAGHVTDWKAKGNGVIHTLTACAEKSWFAVARNGSRSTELWYPADRSIRRLQDRGAAIEGLTFSSDGTLCVERTANDIILSDPMHGAVLERISLASPVSVELRPGLARKPVAICRDAAIIAAIDDQQRVCLFSRADGLPVAIWSIPHSSACTALAFTAAGSLAAGTKDGYIWIWDLPAIRKELRRLKLDWEPPSGNPSGAAPETVIYHEDGSS